MSLNPLPRMMLPATSALAWNAFCSVAASTGQPPPAPLDAALLGAGLDGGASLVGAALEGPVVAGAALVPVGLSVPQPASATIATAIGSRARLITCGILGLGGAAW